MKLAFYIETKSYWKDIHGNDRQSADGGEMPIIYSDRKDAEERVRKMMKLFTEQMEYTEAISNENHPAKTGTCLYASTLIKKNLELRLEVRLYCIDIL